jgi:ketosteroid isomerase-like protein
MRLAFLKATALCGLVLMTSYVVLLTLPARAGSSDEAAIRDVLEKQTAAWNRGDIEAFMEGYWKSPETEFVGASGVVRGWGPVLARYRRNYPDAKAMGQLSFSNLEIKLLSADAAYALGEYHLVREKDQPSGIFTLILRKLPEGWRIIHDHTTAFTVLSSKK